MKTSDQNNQDNQTGDKTINIHENWDVNFWCEEFNLGSEELTEIVRNVGPTVHDVRVHLAKKLLVAWPQAY